MRFRVFCITVLMLILNGIPLVGCSNNNQNNNTNQVVHGEGENVVKSFFNVLKSDRKPSRKFSINDTPLLNIEIIVGYISQKGLIVNDVNSNKSEHFSSSQITESLSGRHGEPFRTFAHISFLCAHTKTQYNDMKIHKVKNGMVAVLGTWYELEFEIENGSMKLKSCKYINHED